MNLLNAEQLHKHLLEDLENCESYSFAIAWVTNNDYYQSIYENIEKVETGVIGLNLYNTAPQVLEECCDLSNIHFRQDKMSVFHPKIHVFKFDKNAHIYIGSSNLTFGGLAKNTELNLKIETLINSDLSSKVLNEIRNFANEALSAEILNEKFIEEYQKKYSATVDFNLKVKNADIDNIQEALNDVEEQSILELSWNEYAERISNEVYYGNNHAFEQRLNLLDKCQTLFKQYGSLKSMPLEDQRIIVGVTLAGDKDYYSYRGWFGPLGEGIKKTKGIYNSKGEKFNQQAIDEISDAVDTIPLEGDIDFETNEKYVNKLLPVFGWNPKTSEASALYSRFLVLKRPDCFIALNGGNEDTINYYYSTSSAPKNYADYWNLIQWLKQAKWFISGDTSSSAWKYRMALVDSLTYSYTNQDYL